MYRVIICGPRDFKDYGEICKAVETSTFIISEIVHGAATGADTLAGDYASDKKIKCKEFPADWKNLDAPDAEIATNNWGGKYNKNAGFYRNTKMAEYVLESCKKDGLKPGCIAIKMKTGGTEHMIKTAKELGLEVYEYVPYTDFAKSSGNYLHEF